MARTKLDPVPAAADRLLLALSSRHASAQKTRRGGAKADPELVRALELADLLRRTPEGTIELTAAGRARASRLTAPSRAPSLDPFLAQHVGGATSTLADAEGPVRVVVDEGESPLAWLARRKGRDGAALIAPVQLQAGERLRADFTRAQLTPRVTSSWSGLAAERGRGASGSGTDLIDVAIAARQRVRGAIETVGPEFAGLLLDVCCFLKGLEDVERERGWPARSAKVVLQLGLDRLARHYGYEAEARGPAQAALRTWLAADAAFSTGLMGGAGPEG